MNNRTDITGNDRLDALSFVSRVTLREEAPGSSRRVFPILLLCVFFAALLLALIAGVAVYKSTSDTQNRVNAQRESLGLITNVVHANDSTGAIATGEGPEGKSLVIVESLDSGTYETRLYAYEGRILQEYSLASSPYTPEKASVVAESSTFSFNYANGLLAVTTDQGTAEVALRYTQGGK